MNLRSFSYFDEMVMFATIVLSFVVKYAHISLKLKIPASLNIKNNGLLTFGPQFD